MADARGILNAMNASPPLANLITLGARDLPTLRNFYRTLGWPQIIDDGEFVAFELRGIVLALFPLANSPASTARSPMICNGNLAMGTGSRLMPALRQRCAERAA